MAARNQRGAVFPSPVVILSVLAVAMAGIAYVATRGGEPTEREVTPVVQEEKPKESPSPSYQPTKDAKPKKPPVRRGKVYVEVYNNSGITGLAGRVADRATGIGWAVVGSDNWYGTIPSTTVYYPQKLKRAARTLALDLGVQRTAPAVDPMRQDRLTLILTEPLR
ncbi:LytR C-terminal domain-containing protein [Nocardioides sp. YIM 152315]|uniref:LytR C-terminal domain-containing protein n=1 Tax=Nocardioides sp. YIM 152315 TaxID=3031760 RepID=UPI0023DA9ACD|nr:LytR C-terminal domain-containing protein [Nocardioides sp. YIM 152315]MDF1604894.1 LytR C-terminal domain-containing protein [Nocardioides sp. YIM 152315]